MRTRYDLPALIDARGYSVAAEIGVQHGYFSYYLLRHSRLSLLWSVDSWSGKWSNLRSDAEAHLAEFGIRSRLIHASSAEAARLAGATGVRFDFVYIDADHSYRAVQADMNDWWPLVRPGGLLAGHDHIEAPRCGVIRAVSEFASMKRLEVTLTSEPWSTWLIDKPAG